MSRITWKEKKIITVALKDGIYIIAQMIKSPYLVFFDLFKDDSNWDDIDLTNAPILFVQAVTRQFIKKSEVKEIKTTPAKGLNIPNHWIHPDAGARKVKVWKGTDFEKEFITLGRMGASLVEKDILKDGKYDHPSGVFDKVLIKSIDFDDSEVINKHGLTNIEVYPNLNERLYLCYKLGKNVDPQKDLLFDKDLPKEYKTYIDIISGKIQLSELGY